MASTLLLAVSGLAIAGPHDSLPEQYWQYMDGYRYEYSGNCLVGWDVGSAEFIVPGACSVALYDRLNSDAIKSIEYMRSKSDARNFHEYYTSREAQRNSTSADSTARAASVTRTYSIEEVKNHAKDLWRVACLDAKEMKPALPNEVIGRYPSIEPMHALRIFSNAKQTVIGLGGMVNCAEQGYYAVEMYASDIDIRAKQ